MSFEQSRSPLAQSGRGLALISILKKHEMTPF